MPRQLTLNPPPHPPAPARRTMRVTLETVTPMFGGSAHPGEVNAEHPVRPASVRGHLRFWWRATQQSSLNKETLFKQEEQLFGSDQEHGCVQVGVVVLNKGQRKAASRYGGGKDAGPLEAYFLFPFRQGNPDGLEGVTFEVEVSFDPRAGDQAAKQVERALQAWIAFGGIGARTRRGCGALRAIGDSASQFTLQASQLHQLLEGPELQQGNDLADRARFPSLRGAKLLLTDVKPEPRDGLTLWRDLGRFWAKFHKGHYARAYNPLGGAAWLDHPTLLQRRPTGEVALVKPYLGLPLVYNSFKGKAFGGTINAAGAQSVDGRFASPVILKPIALQGGLAGAVLILNGPEPKQVSVKEWGAPVTLTIDRTDPVLRELGAATALEAVALAARRDGYTTEVNL